MLEPSSVNPRLKDEYIDAVGHLLVEAHNRVIDRADVHDNSWSLGCTSHTWRGSFLINASLSGEYPWLKMIDPSNRYVFSVNGVECSMYKGSSEQPKKNILSRATEFPELRQMGLFSESDQAPELVWYFALETGPEGEVVNMQFVGMTPNEDVLASRVVPLDTSFNLPSIISETDFEPVELPPVKPQLPTSRDDTSKRDDSSED